MLKKALKNKISAISLFSSAGIGEAFLESLNIDVVVANELLKDRADLYQKIYPQTKMICGDILTKETFNKIVKESGNVDMVIATPPCQGMSIAGKNREIATMHNDNRNHLVFRALELIKIKKPKIILFENVPNFLKIKLPYKGSFCDIEDILRKELGPNYIIESAVLDASDFGVPQRRLRAFVKAYKKDIVWPWPKKKNKISVEDAIGFLPSLEAGEVSKIKWHFARNHSKEHILWMKNTPTGKSAFENKINFPKKENGERIKGYNTTYRRILWNEPSPTITMRNDAISSQLNVHPGRKQKNGTYSDARVLTPLELMILSSLPKNFPIPEDTSETLIRKCLGECVPPLLVKSVLQDINL